MKPPTSLPLVIALGLLLLPACVSPPDPEDWQQAIRQADFLEVRTNFLGQEGTYRVSRRQVTLKISDMTTLESLSAALANPRSRPRRSSTAALACQQVMEGWIVRAGQPDRKFRLLCLKLFRYGDDLAWELPLTDNAFGLEIARLAELQEQSPTP